MSKVARRPALPTALAVAPGRPCVTRSARLLVMILIVWAVILGRTSPASAQGTDEMLPDPISGGELTQYMNRLQLVDHQRQAAVTFHEQYKAQFKQLRENEIEKFLEEMRGMQKGGGGGMPKRADLETMLKDRDRLMTRIAALDDSFFGSLQPLLTEEQMNLLPRARMARDRQRHKAPQMMPFMGAANIDLSRMIQDIELSSEERAAVDGVLAGYEVRLTRSDKDLYQATTDMWLDIFKALEERGFGNTDDFTNPETAKAAMEAMQQIWAEVTKKMQATARQIGDLNRQTYRGIETLLSKKPARQLRNRFYQRAYPDAAFNAQGDLMFDRALKFKELTDEQRHAIEAAREQFQAASDRTVDEMIELIEKFQADFSPFDAPSSWQDHQAKLTEKQTKLNDQVTAARASLDAIIGAELAGKLNMSLIKTAGKPKGAGGAGEAGEAGGAAADQVGDEADAEVKGPDAEEESALAKAQMGSDDTGPDEFLPNSIGAKELSAYARRLGLSETDEAILKELHREYMARYDAIRDNQVKAVQEAQGQLWSTGGDASQTPAQRVDRLAKARASAITAIRALDDWFFTEIGEVALTTDAQAQMLQRVRMSRQRVAFNRGGSMLGYSAFGGSREGSIDLVRLLEQQQLDEAGWRTVDVVLLEYEKPVTDAMQARFQISLDAEKAMEDVNLRMRDRQDTGDMVTIGLEYQKVWQENGRKVADAARVAADLNRRTLPLLVSALPAESGRSLRNAYNLKAFPSVYTDPKSAEPKIDSALKLPGLTDEQRAQVEDIAKSFRSSYNTLSEQMVQATPIDQGWVDFKSQDAMQDWQKKNSKLATLRYERDEASFKAVNQLRGVLTAEQVAAIGGLEEPKKSDDRRFGVED